VQGIGRVDVDNGARCTARPQVHLYGSRMG
jgi:hypothetical protein